MTRRPQLAIILATLISSWLGMQAVHELGHVAGAWLTGGRVARVVLHPLTISRTDLAANPHPLVVAWAGPVGGVLLPLAGWAAARFRGRYVVRFFAGFCLIANGAYLAVGSFDGVGDAGDLLRHRSPAWHLWLFGGLTVPAGFALWHGQGPHFGLAGGRVDGRVAAVTAVVAGALLLLGFAVGGE